MPVTYTVHAIQVGGGVGGRGSVTLLMSELLVESEESESESVMVAFEYSREGTGYVAGAVRK